MRFELENFSIQEQNIHLDGFSPDAQVGIQISLDTPLLPDREALEHMVAAFKEMLTSIGQTMVDAFEGDRRTAPTGLLRIDISGPYHSFRKE